MEYVKEQTPKICLEAVKKNAFALYHVKNQTPEICLEAVKKDWRTLRFVKNQTPESCLEAVRQNWRALELVRDIKLKAYLLIKYRTNSTINPKLTKWWV